MRTRRWLLVVGIAALLAVAAVALPLPRACDPRREEVPRERYAELARFSGARTHDEVAQALRHVDPAGQLAPYHTLGDAALEIRPYAGDPAGAVRVTLRPPGEAGPSPPARTLRRIALDPGHNGGTWSRLEKRHVEPSGGTAVREGDLAWATARLAERALRAAGFEVALLRGPPPEAPYPTGADPAFDVTAEAAFRLSDLSPRERPSPLGLPWLTPLGAWELERQRANLVRSTPFELYTRFELRRRARVAEGFAPDVTLSLHWDLTESGKNGVLVFVPGNSVAGDLGSASQRFWAFRHVLDGTSAETLRLARVFARSLMRHFDLPAMTAEDFSEARANWRTLDAGLGVFARDVAIPRRTPGVALILEGPCVNHPDEYQRLLGTEIEVDGRRYPARVQQYADAVVEGLKAAADLQPPR
jgi:N-acetylmuramoyl-L-alanine amidase